MTESLHVNPGTFGDENAEQARFWNEDAGPRWVDRYDALDAQIGSIGLRAMEAARIAPGERVLDVGCGCGHTLVQLSRRVGESGRVTGVDLSAPMLEKARQRLESAGIANVTLLRADGQVHSFDSGSHDVVFSRFGVMFFSSPRRAFENLRRALRPGGRLAFACWRERNENPWMSLPMAAVARHVELPAPTGSGEPGPFAFGDGAYLRALLQRSGFEDVHLEKLDQTISVGGATTLEEAVSFVLGNGALAAALRDGGPELEQRVSEALSEALEPFARDGGVRLPSAAWIVTGRQHDE